MRSNVGVDGESPGTGGVARGGSNRRCDAADAGGAPASNWGCSGYNVARDLFEEKQRWEESTTIQLATRTPEQLGLGLFITTEYWMPGRTGYELLKHVKNYMPYGS
nr:two-component response regulator ORR6-like [Lolium perenne]